MVYLDTHIVVWLFAGLVEKFTPNARELINTQDILVSPIVRLELQYLHEIQRVAEAADGIITDLAGRIGLKVCNRAFDAVVVQALALDWTRDPFDRLIVAQASLGNNVLISKDEQILEHYAHARW